MIHEFKINIKEILSELATSEQRTDLLWYMFTDACSQKEFNSFLNRVLNDKLESETEFDNRGELKKAYEVVIEELNNELK